MVLGALVVPATTPAASDRAQLPARIADADFWRMIDGFSEGDGYFQSDNLVSNELTFQWVIPRLRASWGPGRVYLGVGPDQNFTYLAALRPPLAFIVDIRRDNLRLQLFYKALLELSPTRIDFLSWLFSRAKPEGLPAGVDVGQLFAAFRTQPPVPEMFGETLRAVRERLMVEHRFPLTAADQAHLEYVLTAFFYSGPDLAYANTGRSGRYPSYQDLMVATDEAGQAHGFLATEGGYGAVRDLQLRNLVVPVVGDFAGAKALRAVGDYVRGHGATVGAIYTSNVEQYLFQYGTWPAYYANVATLPVDDRTQFVRSCFTSCATVPWSRSVQLLDPVTALLADVAAGKVRSYYDVVMRPPTAPR